MPLPFSVVIQNFGEGSLNQGASPQNLLDNEYAWASNWYVHGGLLNRRGGTTLLTRNPATDSTGATVEEITGLALYSRAGVQFLLAGSETGLWRKTGAPTAVGDLVRMSLFEATAGTISDSPKPWTALQYKDVMFWLREDLGRMRRGREDFAQPAGLTAPSTAPTLASAGSGVDSIPAAAFFGVYTCYDSTTDDESNPSPVSAVLNHNGVNGIVWSGLAACPAGEHADSKRLYRTLPDQTGEYFRVATIPSSATFYNFDTSLVEDLGPAAEFDNNVPPDNLYIGDVWEERMWASDGVSIFFSKLGKMEAWPPQNRIEVAREDGGRITAVRAFGDRLLIGKYGEGQGRSVHYVVREGDGFALRALTREHGVVSHRSMVTFENHAQWYGGDNLYLTDGNSVQEIGNIKLLDYLSEIPEFRKEFSVAVVVPETQQYMIAMSSNDPTTSPAQNIQILAQNYRSDSWTELNWRSGNYVYPDEGELHEFSNADVWTAPNTMIPVGDGTGRIFAAFGPETTGYLGHIFLTLDSGVGRDNVADGEGPYPIDAYLVSKAYNLGVPDQVKALRRMGLTVYSRFASTIPENITLSAGHALIDNAFASFTPITTRFLRLDADNDAEKWFNLSTRGRPSVSFVLSILYQGRTPISLGSLYLEGVAMNRRRRQPQ